MILYITYVECQEYITNLLFLPCWFPRKDVLLVREAPSPPGWMEEDVLLVVSLTPDLAALYPCTVPARQRQRDAFSPLNIRAKKTEVANFNSLVLPLGPSCFKANCFIQERMT